MAKSERLTKKDVLEMFDQVDFREHFKGTGKSEAEIKRFVDRYTTDLSEKGLEEAEERAIIARLTGELGEIFKKDFQALDRRIANAQFERARSINSRKRVEALKGLFEAAKTDYQNENRDELQENMQNSADNRYNAGVKADEVSNAQNISAAKEAERARLQAELQAMRDKEAELRATAKKIDEANFYITKYEEEYKGTLGFLKRTIGYPRDLEKRAAAIKAYVETKIAEEVHTENADGTISTPEALRNGTVHTLFDDTVPGPAERAHEKAMKELQRQIRNLTGEIKNIAAEEAAAQAEQEAFTQQAEVCQQFIDGYNQEIEQANANINAMNGSLINARANETSYGILANQTRLELAEHILENELADSNPLIQLAYEGYIKQIREQQRIVADFKTNAGPELTALIDHDLNLNDVGYMDIAFEHYVAQAFGSGRYENDLLEAKRDSAKYFGKYIHDFDKRYEEATRKYEVTATAMDYFAQEMLASDYVGRSTTREYDEKIDQQVANNMAAIDARVQNNRNRLEIINPNYDRIARYSTIPTVREYMALTMMREELIQREMASEAAGKRLDREDSLTLAEVSKRLEKTIEQAKRDGTIIDLADATQIAVETLIPGYDQVAEFAELNGLDIRVAADRTKLAAMQQEFASQEIMSQVAIEDIMKYAEFTGADIFDKENRVDAAKRDEFVRTHADEMIAYFTQGTPMVHHTLQNEPISKYILSEVGRDVLIKNPQSIAKIYETFGQTGISVTFNDGKLYIATEGNQPTPIDPARLVDVDFMKSVGIIMDLPQEKVDAYSKLKAGVPNIQEVLDKRDSFCYVKTADRDLGILGQAGIYTAQSADFDFAAERDALRKAYDDPKKLSDLMEKFKKDNPYADPQDFPTILQQQKEALRFEYQQKYFELYTKHQEKQAEFAKMAGNEELATPVDMREDTGPIATGHNDLYDKAEIKPDKKSLYKGGKARTAELVDKIMAIDAAREEFREADEVGVELLNEGVAVSVIEMLGALEKLKVTNPDVIKNLNAAILAKREEQAQAAGQEVAKADEYAINMDENRKLSLSVGDNVYSVGEDGKVKIEQREAAQTVSDAEPVQH